jgi:hypothetical protein
MAIQELGIRSQININQLRGDRKSYKEGRWDCYGKKIDDYDKSFQGVLKRKHTKDLLKGKKDSIVIDLMAPSDAVSSLLKHLSGKKKFGLAISLEDLRSAKQKKRDLKSNVIQLPGDILESSTWKKIEDQLQGRKANLIMARPIGGYDCIPKDSRIYAALLNKAWGLLNKDGGILLVEVLTDFYSQTGKMVNEFRKNGIEVSDGMSLGHTYSMKIVRAPNSPDKLPFPKR